MTAEKLAKRLRNNVPGLRNDDAREAAERFCATFNVDPDRAERDLTHDLRVATGNLSEPDEPEAVNKIVRRVKQDWGD